MLPGYARFAAIVGRPVVLVAALVMSAPGEYQLARLAGWDHAVALLMPVCLSVYAACAAVIAATRPKGMPGRVSALVGAGMALALAMSAQIIAHLIAAGHMTAGPWLVAATSSVPPVVVAHMLHLAAMPKHDEEEALSAPEELTADTREESVTALSAPVIAREEPVTALSVPADTETKTLTVSACDVASTDTVSAVVSAGCPSDADIEEAVTAIRDRGDKVNGRTVGEAFGVSARTGRRYLAELAVTA